MNLRTTVGRYELEFTGDSFQEIIQQISSVEEVLRSGAECGSCSSNDTYLRYRQSQGYNFYEIQCSACGCALKIGEHRESPHTMFPSRKDRDGNVVGSDGWVSWRDRAGVQDQANSGGNNPSW